MIECDYSFDMLYRAAFKKNISQKAKLQLQSLDQEGINKLVAKWAKTAEWNTEMKTSRDGNLYLSFWPR